MNLLLDPWIPALDRDGARRLLAPADLTAADCVAFASRRADGNDALRQFAIGLLQTAMAPSNVIEHARIFRAPPTRERLVDAFAPFTPHFEFDGDGPRFMQDHELCARDIGPSPIGALWIGVPTGNTLENNADLFIKRGRVRALCPSCTAIALITLQFNGPAGGTGYRTGVRGGGPITTTVIPGAVDGRTPSLFHRLWANVLPRASLNAVGGNPDLDDPQRTFPWAGQMSRLQPSGGQVAPADQHPAMVLWAHPRRICIDFDDTLAGACDNCDAAHPSLLTRYVEVNQGLNFKGPWRHPLTPYYGKPGELLPVHAGRAGLGWQHWIGWTLGQYDVGGDVERIPAAVVSAAIQAPLRWPDGSAVELRLHACGFDFESAKPLCWYERSMPLHHLEAWSDMARGKLRGDVMRWLAAAHLVAPTLRRAVGQAWFRRESKGDLGFVTTAFWSRTETPFHELVARRVAAGPAPNDAIDEQLARDWLIVLRRAAYQLFDDHVGSARVLGARPGLLRRSRQTLNRILYGEKLLAALGLPDEMLAADQSESLTQE